MSSNNFQKAAHILALKLTAIIVGILIGIAICGFFIGSKFEMSQEEDFFRDRMDRIQRMG
jgi:uncharacterized membrane protein YwzB